MSVRPPWLPAAQLNPDIDLEDGFVYSGCSHTTAVALLRAAYNQTGVVIKRLSVSPRHFHLDVTGGAEALDRWLRPRLLATPGVQLSIATVGAAGTEHHRDVAGSLLCTRCNGPYQYATPPLAGAFICRSCKSYEEM